MAAGRPAPPPPPPAAAAPSSSSSLAAAGPPKDADAAPPTTTATPTTPPAAAPPDPRTAALRHLACGFLAGTANVAVGYPLDTVKVRLQADRGGGAFGGSILRAGRAVVRAGGARALYRGMTSPLVGGAAETAVNYAVYGTALERIVAASTAAAGRGEGGQAAAAGAPSALSPPPTPQAPPPPPPPPPLAAVAAAGAVAGVALSFVLAPTELVKCRLQMSQYPTPAACVRDVLARHGARGMMRGLGATVAREAPGNAIFFVAYEWARRGWGGAGATGAGAGRGGRDGGVGYGGGGGGSSSNGGARREGGGQGGRGERGRDGGVDDEDGGGSANNASASDASDQQAWREALSNVGRATVCGAFAGTAMWLAILPLDVAKTRIQAAHPGSAWDRGLAWHLKALWREGGAGALWAGARATVVRAVPANAAQWAVWEAAMRWLDGGGRRGEEGRGREAAGPAATTGAPAAAAAVVVLPTPL